LVSFFPNPIFIAMLELLPSPPNFPIAPLIPGPMELFLSSFLLFSASFSAFSRSFFSSLVSFPLLDFPRANGEGVTDEGIGRELVGGGEGGGGVLWWPFPKRREEEVWE